MNAAAPATPLALTDRTLPDRPRTTSDSFAGLRALLMDLHRLDGQIAASRPLDLPQVPDLVTLLDRTLDQVLHLAIELESSGAMRACERALRNGKVTP